MCIHIIICFCRAQLCMNDYFIPISFPILFCTMILFSCLLDSFARTTDEIKHPWCIYSHGEFLGVLSSYSSISPSTQRSPTREYCSVVSA